MIAAAADPLLAAKALLANAETDAHRSSFESLLRDSCAGKLSENCSLRHARSTTLTPLALPPAQLALGGQFASVRCWWGFVRVGRVVNMPLLTWLGYFLVALRAVCVVRSQYACDLQRWIFAVLTMRGI